MDREAGRDLMDRRKESVRYRQEEMLRSLLISGQKTEVKGNEDGITIAERGREMHGDIYGQNQADQTQLNCVDNLQMHPISSETEGREDTHSMGKLLTTGSGGERLSVCNIINERTQASKSTISTEMILGQPRGLDKIKMESTVFEGRNEIIGGEGRVKVLGTTEP